MSSMLRGSGRLLPRAGITVGTAVLLLGLLPVPAQAHRDGCHRWHSCPSDTGSQWRRRREWLVELAEFAAELGDAEQDAGGWAADWGKRKRGESVWWVTDADLVQPGTDGTGVCVRDSGTLVVTGQRVILAGRKRREWLFSKLVRIEHSGGDLTWMRVANRTTVSGVRYRRESEKTRVAIESAVAEAPAGEARELGTGRGPVLARLRQAIREHDRHRPSPPEQPAAADRTAVPVTSG